MRKRTIAWILAVIIAFVLGWLLARRMQHPVAALACPPPGIAQPGTAANPGGGGTRGGGAPGHGSPVKLGANGSGNGTVAGSGGRVTGDAAGAPPSGSGTGDGDLDSGGFNDVSGNTVGKGFDSKVSGSNDGDDSNGSADSPDHSQPSTDRQGSPDVVPSLDSSSGLAPPPPPPDAQSQLAGDTQALPIKPEVPGDRVVVAGDYRYDNTELPRYAGNGERVASGTVLPADGSGSAQHSSIVEIVTDDKPDTVIAWYRAQLPSDWVEQAPPTEQATAQAVQEANTHAASDTPVDSMLKMIMAPQLQQAQAALAKVGEAHLTFFWPQDRSVDNRSVLIMVDKKTGKTAVLMSRKVER